MLCVHFQKILVESGQEDFAVMCGKDTEATCTSKGAEHKQSTSSAKEQMKGETMMAQAGV